MNRRVRDHLGGLAVLLVALALRLAYVTQSEQRIGLDLSRLSITDNFVFAQWARTIADGDWLCRAQPHAYHVWTREVAPESKWLEWYGGAQTYHQAPLYPYFVACVYALVNRGHETIAIVQAVLGAITCWLTWLLARRLVSPLAGIVAGMLLACMGAFYFYDDFLLRDGPLALLTVLVALALERAVRRGRTLDWLLAGASLGLFTLGKETGPALLALTILVFAWARRRDPAAVARTAALLVVGWLLLLAPAIWRNEQVGAPPLKLSTRGPEVFVVGNAKGQDGVGWDPHPDLLRTILVDSNFQLGKAVLYTLATHRTDPLGYLRLLWNKTEAFFNGYEIPNNANFYLHRLHLPALRAGFVPLGVVSALALLGLLLGLPRRRELVVPYGLFVALAGSVIALYVLGRFRTHVMPLMAFFAAVTVDWFVRAIRRRRWSATVVAAVPLAGLLAWTAPGPEAYAYTDLNKNTGMMMLLVRAGNFERAFQFEDALQAQYPEMATHERDPTAPAWQVENTAEAKLAMIDEAFRHFRKALEWPDDRAEQHVEIGRGYTALVAVSKRDERRDLSDLAYEQYQLARNIDPDAVGAWYGEGLLHAQFEEWGPAFSAMQKELEARERSPAPDPTGIAIAWRDAGMIRLTIMKDDLGALPMFRTAAALGLEDPRLFALMARIEVNTQYRDNPPVRVQGRAERVYDPQLGLRHAERAIALAPDEPLVMEACAYVFYAHGQYDRAVDLLQRLAKAQPWRREELQDVCAAFLTVRDRKRAAEAGPAAETPDAAAGSEAAPDEAGGPP